MFLGVINIMFSNISTYLSHLEPRFILVLVVNASLLRVKILFEFLKITIQIDEIKFLQTV